jgi:hypothetical protein
MNPAGATAMRTWITRQLPWLLLATLFALAVSMHVRTAFAEETPVSALRVAAESRGERYAGDCGATVSPADIGKVCSRLVEERGNVQAYLVGRTFSEFSRWTFVVRTDRGWQTVAEAPLNFHATSIEIPWP